MTVRAVLRGAYLATFMLVACGESSRELADDEPQPELDWQVEAWPTTLPDPVAAGERAFELLHGEWRLPLAPGQACTALDCPGAADGVDPVLGEGFEVTRYTATVFPPSRLWRDLGGSKALVEPATGLEHGYGQVAMFYRRALDGSLVVVRDRPDHERSPADFWRVSFADLGDRIQLVVDDPSVLFPSFRAQVGDDVVIESEGFAFRAPRTRDVLPEVSLGEYDALRDPATSVARLVELLDQARELGHFGMETTIEALLLLGHEAPAVRSAAAAFVLRWYLHADNPMPEVISLDRLLARLSIDPEPTIRAQIAEGLLGLATHPPTPNFEPFLYHCILDEPLAACAATAEPATAAACQGVLDRDETRYGFCPWLEAR